LSGSSAKISSIQGQKEATNTALTQVTADQKEIDDLITALEQKIEQENQLAETQA